MSDKQTLTATEELRPDAEQTAEKNAAQVMADAPEQDTQPAGETPAETVSETENAPAVADEGPAAAAGEDAVAPAGPTPSADAPAPETEPQLPVSGDGGAQPPAEPPATNENGEEEEDGKPMGLLDHLNELRWRLVRCFIAALVGFCLCWAVVEPLFDILTLPLNNALGAVGAHAQ